VLVQRLTSTGVSTLKRVKLDANSAASFPVPLLNGAHGRGRDAEFADRRPVRAAEVTAGLVRPAVSDGASRTRGPR